MDENYARNPKKRFREKRRIGKIEARSKKKNEHIVTI